jgi:hypothetical protein
VSEAAGSCSISLEDGILEGLLRLKFGLCMRRQPGKSEDLNGANSAGSVRVEDALFMLEMVDFHSFFGTDEGVSQRGRRSSSTFSASCAEEGSPR